MQEVSGARIIDNLVCQDMLQQEGEASDYRDNIQWLLL